MPRKDKKEQRKRRERKEKRNRKEQHLVNEIWSYIENNFFDCLPYMPVLPHWMNVFVIKREVTVDKNFERDSWIGRNVQGESKKNKGDTACVVRKWDTLQMFDYTCDVQSANVTILYVLMSNTCKYLNNLPG